jgi:membrane protein
VHETWGVFKNSVRRQWAGRSRRFGRNLSPWGQVRAAMRAVWLLLKETFSEWRKNKAVRFGAALSYYTVFSLPPLLAITVTIATIFFGEKAARGKIVEQFQGLLGEQGGQTILNIIGQASNFRAGTVAAVIAVAMLVIGATAVFVELQDALNTVWEVKPKPKSSLTYLLKIRVLSILVVLGTAFLLLVSLIISTLLSAFANYTGQLLSGPPGLSYLLHAANFLISFGIVTLLFAMLFKVLPDAQVVWKDVWLGAAFTALLFNAGKFLIGLYLGRSRIGSVFGAAGSLVILLAWIYYTSQILFFGAEFTRIYADTYGSKIRPARYAKRATREDRAEQGLEPSNPSK